MPSSGASCFPPNPRPSRPASNATPSPSGDAALRAFRAHHRAGRALDANPALMPALGACARLPAAGAEAEQIHALLVKSGVPRAVSDVHASTSLVRVYARLGRADDARKVFDGMPERTVVSWNVLLDGLVRARDLDAAWELFVEMPERNVVSWNTVITGFARHGWAQEAVDLFVEMTAVYGLAPDETTMVGFISAVRDIGLLGVGRSAHGYVLRREFSLDGDLGVALIKMYTRCGSMGAAHSCFKTVANKNVEHWTSVIGGFAAHGHPEMALRLFGEMRQLGIEPNGVTFVAVLNACSHGGLVDEGFKYFGLLRSMGIRPTIQHYGCLVDLLGRAGFLKEAFNLANSLPKDPGFVIWSSLLAACRSRGNVEMAEFAASKLADAKPSHGSSYVLLSNMYAGAKQWEDLKRTRRRMEEHGVTKKPGLSWIEVDGNVHSFATADKLHTESEGIYQMLEVLKPNLTSVECEPETFALSDFDHRIFCCLYSWNSCFWRNSASFVNRITSYKISIRTHMNKNNAEYQRIIKLI
ncbi:pentatricopeptide repeat-containing protein At3g22690-like [Phragmites australis]|uniref:pentatricopeptide repeat-containing protein At3g22690-like n=1 Tax=Phragmites australis TaxID=29695 RepID=UPI002D77BE0A|nr:pentatricopeptide repeat-containing protein At3g22690-like [Phragmites australis]